MSDLDRRLNHTGVFFNPSRARGAAFQASCAEMFSHLVCCESVDAASTAVVQRDAALLVLDLNGYEYLSEMAGVGALIRNRAGKAILVLCPYDHSAWLPELMAYGTFDYRLSPVLDDELQQAVKQALEVPLDAAAALQQELLDKEKELRDLLGVQRSLQRALSGFDTISTMASQVCLALCNFPGVRHTALLSIKERGDLQLVAQEARNHLDLGRLLQRRDRLLQSPLRDVFPPLMAVVRGEMILLDAPEKAGDPELAMALHDRNVRMVLALPLRAEPGGPEMGSIALMFDRHIVFSREQFACFASLAQFISFGLGMSELRHQNDVLSGQLSQMNTLDTLTGAANRRSGEDTLDNEIRRARRYGLPLAVLSFDVGSFRSSNDLYGSPVGEPALRKIAETVQGRLRTSDTLARMRGEEFLVVATHTSADDAVRLAEKLRAAIAEADLPGAHLGASVSISLSVAQVGPEEAGPGVLDRLDAALQLAKRAGRNCIQLAA
ncbi:diguanylate cyclase [Duganella sp. FT80W]|uniref:diguanylate cyclase n=1 Tax=Duganella guangzhouensis TaxID=2666084 RepID=A0A6I2KWU8_9BURK|nr:GGDEF domain-containing protein [Duganella guangzhouensis]MRW88696.1 diguanylate cyclase [Duganella guangzhouensis]